MAVVNTSRNKLIFRVNFRTIWPLTNLVTVDKVSATPALGNVKSLVGNKSKKERLVTGIAFTSVVSYQGPPPSFPASIAW